MEGFYLVAIYCKGKSHLAECLVGNHPGYRGKKKEKGKETGGPNRDNVQGVIVGKNILDIKNAWQPHYGDKSHENVAPGGILAYA